MLPGRLLPLMASTLALAACDKGQPDRAGELFRGGLLYSAAYELRLADGSGGWQVECLTSNTNCAARAQALCPQGYRRFTPTPLPAARLDYGPPDQHFMQFIQCSAPNEETRSP